MAANPVEPDLALHQSLPHLLRNLLRNLLRHPVDPDLALHQSLPEPSSQTFSGTLLNLTWLCTKASWTFSGTFSGICWTCPGSAPKPPGTFSRTLSGNLFNLTWLCTKASQTKSETLFNLTRLCTKAFQTFSGTFGTFSGTSLNLTRRLHQSTPQLFWAEDPISLHCWGKRSSTGANSKKVFFTLHAASPPYLRSWPVGPGHGRACYSLPGQQYWMVLMDAYGCL